MNQKELTTLNLKYNVRAQPLKTLAFAELVAKALYLEKDYIGIKKINRNANELLGNNISRDFIYSALSFLESEGRLDKGNRTWKLTNEEQKKIKQSLNAQNQLRDVVLNRHFPEPIKMKTLRKWFVAANTAFFGHFGDHLIESISKGDDIRYNSKPLEVLLQESIKTYNLTSYTNDLVEGYTNFVSSKKQDDAEYFMQLVFTLCSTRLMAADIGYDITVLEQLQNSTIALDTNILVSLALERKNSYKKLKAVFKALHKIGVKVVYSEGTKREYTHLIGFMKRETIAALNCGYTPEILKSTDNDFIRTAIDRGCNDESTFEEFFNSLLDIPTLEDFNLNLKLDVDPTTLEAEKNAENDKKLMARIQSENLGTTNTKHERSEKSEASLLHDATLIHICEAKRRSNENYWILSSDRTLNICAKKRATSAQLPAVISLDILVQVLALHSSGLSLAATDFAPILSQLMLKEALPQKSAFTVLDLKSIYDLDASIVLLPPENVKDIAAFVNKAVYEGKDIKNDDAFKLEVERRIQRDTKNIGQELIAAKNTVADYMEQLNQQDQILEASKKAFIDRVSIELHNKNKKERNLGIVFRLVGGLVFLSLGYVYYPWGATSTNIFGYVLSIVTFFLEVFSIRDVLGNYRRSESEVLDTAKKIYRNSIE